MKKLLAITILVCMGLSVSAQRQTQTLGRGVVAVNNGSSVTVTWRKMAQEPENAKYNIYVNNKKITSSPISVTNYKTTTSVIPNNSSITVTLVTDKGEGEKSKAFTFKQQSLRNVFLTLQFKGGPLDNSDYTTKYVWPCDLDGDGEMDYVIDRHSKSGLTSKVEAYLRDGTYLWTVDMGPNESISSGQDDQVTAWDLDCDGYGEVMIQSSDGTRFWDKTNNTWGKYVKGSITGDTDNDGIIDYTNQNEKNPPRYFTVVNGMTGAEKASVEMNYNSAYNRTNKASLMGDEYNKHVGKFGVCYFDGVHPGVAMEWHTRSSSGTHYYYSEGFQYDFSSGKAGELKDIFIYGCGSGSFHSIRVGDMDFDGKDELIEGGWTMDHTGQVLFNAGIAHGDRFRTTDINPERPGLETFAIQQNAGDMLGQILYDASTGEAVKKWYMSGVGDVGRGDCYDMDKDHLGWEMFSTMNSYAIYNANGDATGKTAYFPTEALWWDGDLGREYLASPDGNGYNAYIAKYGTGRLIEMAKEASWKVKSEYGARAAFWGDIIGDWREEVILKHYDDAGNIDGIYGYSTDYTSDEDRIYCLMEEPSYHGQMLCKGYYQTPMPAYYLGWDMPRPQLPPTMVTDLVCKATNSYTDFNRSSSVSYAAGKSVLFDLNTASAITQNTPMESPVYMMPVIKQTITFTGTGAFAGTYDIWKSQKGTVKLNIPISTTGTTYISEGTLSSTSTIAGPVELRARGILAGSPTLNGSFTIEGALNYDEGKLMPSDTMTFNKGLNIDKRLYIEYTKATDLVKVNGDLSLTSSLIFTISHSVEPTEYKLIEYTGNFSGSLDDISIRGLTGYSYEIVNKDKAIYLIINKQRSPMSDIHWTGAQSNVWDYQTANFSKDGQAVTFVAGDTIVFDDDAKQTNVTINEKMPVGGVVFTNHKVIYNINGNGGISGTANVTFNGTGSVKMNSVKSDYTGTTTINGGYVTVKDISDSGTESSIGAGSEIVMGKGTLIINNASTSMNRTVTLNDTATVQIASGTSAFKGIIKGKGRLVKKGAGQLNFTYAGTNTYTGGTELAAGKIAMGTYKSTFGAATSRITVTGKNTAITIFNNNSTSQIPSFTNQLEVLEGMDVTINGGQRCSVKPTLYGKGIVKITFPYVRGDFGPNAYNFEGTIEAIKGEVRLASTLNMPKGTLQLDVDNNVYNNTGTHTVKTLITKTSTSKLSSGNWKVSNVSLTDTLKVSGNLQLSSPTITLNRTSGKWTEGEYKVIQCGGNIKINGDVTIMPETPLTGYQWDISELATSGVIRVVKTSEVIGDANNDGKVDVSDITTIAAYILGTTPVEWNEKNADANKDGLIDVTDITTTATIILKNAKKYLE